jgi:peroxiredoxin Q/BCP
MQDTPVLTDDLPAPDFTLPSTGGEFRLSGLTPSIVVLFFYPKDNTPGCTTEAGQFRDHHAAFSAAGAKIFGLSRDSLKSHQGFKAKLSLPYDLISDPDEVACSLYGVIKMKNLYGKQVRGIERSTFVIDPSGRLRRQWRAVKVPGHVEDVLTFVRSLSQRP